MTDPIRAPLSRRAFVLRCGAIAASLGVVPLLQACSSAAPPAATSAPAAAPTAAPKPSSAVAAPAASAAPAIKPSASAAPSPSAAAAAQIAPVTAAAPGTAGGTLRVTLGAEPTTLDPAKSSTLFDSDVHDALFDGLFSNDVYDPITGTLAESWNTTDGKTWTITLKKGLKFHDGQEVTVSKSRGSFKNGHRWFLEATNELVHRHAGNEVRPLNCFFIAIASDDHAINTLPRPIDLDHLGFH